VVDNKNFVVNTMERKKVAQLDRYLNIRQDEVKKIGLRLSKGRVTALAGRQIMASKNIELAPVSIHKEEKYIAAGYRGPFKEFDAVKSVSATNMETSIHPNYRIKSPTSKMTIFPLSNMEKSGPKWGN
jgi:hypothetical protein